MSTIITADFIPDLRTILAWHLKGVGYVVGDDLDSFDVAHLYYNARSREISRRPRRVHYSRELVEQMRDAHEIPVNRIAAAAEKGEDLHPYLSTRSTDPSYSDMLFNEWRVHHFHLGEPGKGPKGFVGRTGDLLFALVMPDNIYFISLSDHDAFADDVLLEVMHRNWYDVLTPYRCTGVRAIEGSRRTPAELKKLRAVGLTTLSSTEDRTVYVFDAVALSAVVKSHDRKKKGCLSLRVARLSDDIHRDAHRVEVECRKSAELLRQAIFRFTGQDLAELHLKLVWNDDRIMVAEMQTRFAFDSPA
ncbi:MAG: hypothetical protein EOP83_34940, partial [Verrucomicrobiaceae bacterium]